DLHQQHLRGPLLAEIGRYREQIEVAARNPQRGNLVLAPATQQPVGTWLADTPETVAAAVDRARAAQPAWAQTGVDARAALLEQFAEFLLAQRAELVALMALETGKTLENALEEVREAVDYCRYYAAQARAMLLHATALPGPAGERNALWLRPRGVFACISPWNFPLAIFVGQIAAALVTGNAVLAKPAEQSTLTAHLATSLMFRAGVPESVLHLIAGFGETIGAELCALPGLDGVVFTGGFTTAQSINRQ